MKSLSVVVHPDKIWLGRVKNGYDFLRFRITLTSIQAPTTCVSRRDSKVARLYEQGASTKRIRQYLGKWLGWSLLCTFSVGAYASAPGDPYGHLSPSPCFISNPANAGVTFAFKVPSSRGAGTLISYTGPTAINGFVSLTPYEFRTFSTTLPTANTLMPSSASNEPSALPTTQTIYASFGPGSLGEVCTLAYSLVEDAGTVTRTAIGSVSRSPLTCCRP